MTILLHKRKRRSATVCAMVLILGLAFVSSVSAAPKKYALSVEEDNFLKLVVKHTGQQRSVIKFDPVLCKVARAKAKDMIVRNFFSHVDPSGRGPNFMLGKAGYRLPSYYSTERSGNNVESIAKLTGGAKGAFDLFLKSPAHRPHVLAEDEFYRAQTRIGVGAYRSPKSPFYQTFVFLSAPRNLNTSPPALILVSPAGKKIGQSGL